MYVNADVSTLGTEEVHILMSGRERVCEYRDAERRHRSSSANAPKRTRPGATPTLKIERKRKESMCGWSHREPKADYPPSVQATTRRLSPHTSPHLKLAAACFRKSTQPSNSSTKRYKEGPLTTPFSPVARVVHFRQTSPCSGLSSWY